MKTVTELMVDAYLQGGSDATDSPLWPISKHEKAINYAEQQVKLFAIPDVIKSVCPACQKEGYRPNTYCCPHCGYTTVG